MGKGGAQQQRGEAGAGAANEGRLPLLREQVRAGRQVEALEYARKHLSSRQEIEPQLRQAPASDPPSRHTARRRPAASPC